MSDFREMQRRLDEAEMMIKNQGEALRNLSRMLAGSGEIVNYGNRFKIDSSGALSEYAKKSDLPSTSSQVDLSRYATKNYVNRFHKAGTGIIWTKIEPNSITLNAGTSADTIADLIDFADGNMYHIDEAAATPGQELIVDFTNVADFNYVETICRYLGSSTHSLSVQLYNWVNSTWDTFTSHIGVEITMVNSSFTVPERYNYIGKSANEGKVRVRFIHTQAGNASHDSYIEVVSLYV